MADKLDGLLTECKCGNPHGEAFPDAVGNEFPNNEPLSVGFKRLNENATLPTKAHATDSGFDLYASEDVFIGPGETTVVPTAIALQLPEGYEATVRPRSGVTSRTKLRVQLGTIDNGYNGEIGVIVDNISPPHSGYTKYFIYGVDGKILEQTRDDNTLFTYLIRKGDRIAQLVVQPLPSVEAYEISGELGETERGTGGFGSTGVTKEVTE